MLMTCKYDTPLSTGTLVPGETRRVLSIKSAIDPGTRPSRYPLL
jgi:hypothetical protein